MGLFSSLRSELIDIIEWIDDTHDTLVYRFDRQDNEIKNNAKLVVRESQVAVFVDQGQFADVFSPGTHTLSTSNLPLLSTLKGWKYGFDSPFKSEVYFVSTKQFTDMGWGTPNPVIIRDPELGPVRVRAYGNYSIRVIDPTKFIKEISGTDGNFLLDEIEDQLRSILISGFSDALGESKIPVIDFASKYDEISELCNEKIKPKFNKYGLDLLDFMLENLSLPEELQEILDKKISMNMLGNLNEYSKFQAAQAMEDAVNNPNSGAGEGISMGIGVGIAQNMMQSMNAQHSHQPAQSAAVPPPPPAQAMFHVIINGAQQGPFGLIDIKNSINTGAFTRETLVWKEGMAGWLAAGTVPELSNLFGSMPPPPPPMPQQ